MSMRSIRDALENHLKAMTPALPTSFENASFTPPTDGSAYQEAVLLPANPIVPMGDMTYLEQGVFQVTVLYPLGEGTADAEERAEAIRSHFHRGLTLTVGGVSTIITSVPTVAKGFPDDGQWRVPVSIRWQAQVNT